ncbi:hypothetical protein TNCV_1127961 [Trichonephila clavipes]|nr:hypothetical protein TNCV_1127961 [Trichonephila clavipes]
MNEKADAKRSRMNSGRTLGRKGSQSRAEKLRLNSTKTGRRMRMKMKMDEISLKLKLDGTRPTARQHLFPEGWEKK